jgi:dCMP deaminase
MSLDLEVIGIKPMEKWDKRFVELSEFVSKWSKDPNAQVGAVVVSPRGGAVSTGYNGFPIGVEDSADRLEDNALKQELVVHAEQNALISAGSKAEGATIYVWGKPVCAHCAGAIIQAGIKRVVALNPTSVSKDSKWHKTGKLSLKMFEEAEIKVDFYTVKDKCPIN